MTTEPEEVDGVEEAAVLGPSVAAAPRRIPKVRFFISIALLAALIVFTLNQVGDLGRFVDLARQAQPSWFLLAIGCQVVTYVVTGAIWAIVTRAAGYALPLGRLARLAVEKLSMDHIMPAGGLAGDMVIVGAMRRYNVPATVATETLLIDILAYYGSFGVAAALAFAITAAHVALPTSMTSLMAFFALGLGGVPLLIVWVLEHRDWQPGPRLSRIRWVVDVRNAVAGVDVKRVRDPWMLLTSGALHLAIFALDGVTVWAVFQALGMSVDPLTCFAAPTIAAVAAAVSVLPGGVGSFEAGGVGTLLLLDTPPEAALAVTLMFRGLTLWIPLIPGLLLSRKDLTHLGESLES